MDLFDFELFAKNLKREGCWLGTSPEEFEESVVQLRETYPGYDGTLTERLTKWMAGLYTKFSWQILQESQSESENAQNFEDTLNMFKRAYMVTQDDSKRPKLDRSYYEMFKACIGDGGLKH